MRKSTAASTNNFKVTDDSSSSSYLDVHLGYHASLEGEGHVLLLKYIVDFLGAEDQIFELDITAKETDIKLLFVEAEEQLAKLVFELLIKPSFQHDFINKLLTN